MVKINEDMSHPLTVYKASAGSGKTFTLAVEYIKLLIADPLSYQKILAVTFTNKATEEMKTRIISQLYGLWKSLPDSDDYLRILLQNSAYSEKIIRFRAGEALKSLLHNYNFFRVETIDSFFQSILRNLAHELDLTANLRLDLNDSQVKDEAVDTLFMKLDEDKTVMKWVMGYIEDKISDDDNWNVINDVKKFGKKMFDEKYKSFSRGKDNVYDDDKKFEAQYKYLRETVSKTKQQIISLCDEFDKKVLNSGFAAKDFKSVPITYVKYIRNEDLLKLKDDIDIYLDPEKWCAKSNKRRDEIVLYAENELVPVFKTIVDKYPKLLNLYLSSQLTLKHLNEMRLLRHVENEVRALNRDANRFLLSDTPQLLNSLIEGSDAPFIFEKIGSRIEHIMIDEFQDTSVSQWGNFKKLLFECMSHHDGNLIVGDVKQSIYRWRSGDWRLLNNIENEFIGKPDIITLDTNYRSAQSVVHFNNTFFTEAVRWTVESLQSEHISESPMMDKAYADVVQNSKKKDEGFVSIKLYHGKTEGQIQIEDVVDAVDEMMSYGIPQHKIAIITRKNDELSAIAEYFAENKKEIKIISNEAFRLDSSNSVNIIIHAMYTLNDPANYLSRVSLAKMYQNFVNQNNITDNDLLLNGKDHLSSFLPQRFVEEEQTLLSKPLYDLAEYIYEVFMLDKLDKQNAYVCALYDEIIDFVNSNTSDINLFLEKWENELYRKCIQSDEVDGIRMFTIHKSKGLEFENVIIPFCNWKMENKNTIWCEPSGTEFDELRLVPIDYVKKLKFTCFSEDYQFEHFQNTMDNMNMLYVAFTRAARNLYVIGNNLERGKVVDACLENVSKKLGGSMYIKGDKENPSIFNYGTPEDYVEKKKDTSANVFLQESESRYVRIEIKETHVEFRQSNDSNDFFEDVKDDRRGEGIILHRLFSLMNTVADIDKVLKQIEFEGIVGGDDESIDIIRRMYDKCMNDKQVSDWFSGRWKLFNECTILAKNVKGKLQECRPDRVMTDGHQIVVVDYKTGDYDESGKYQRQVRGYIRNLKNMGYKNVIGYLWYVKFNLTEEVK